MALSDDPRTGRDPMDEVSISRLAREIARDLKPIEHLLDKLKIDSSQFERIQNNPIFQTRMVEEAQIWAASTKSSVRERVATKAAIAVEELLADAVDMVQDREIPGAARVQALQFIAKMGQLGDGTMTRDDGSGRVQINIMIGGQKVSFEKDTQTIEGSALDVTPEVSA